MLGLMVFAALVSLVPTTLFAANSNTMQITPTPRSATTGDVFTVSVDGHVTDSFIFAVGVGVHEAYGTVTFPSNLLSVVSYSAAGTTFGASKSITPGNGNVTFNLSSGPNSAATYQDVHLFTITFKAIAAGTANVGFGSANYGNGSGAGVITPTTTGGKYTIASPPAPVTPTTPTQPTTPSKPATTPKATPKAPTPVATPVQTPTPEETPAPVIDSDGGLKIENVKATATRQANSIAWTLNNTDATPTLTLGTSKGNQKDIDVAKQADGSYLANLSGLKLGTLYYFTIKASTADNLQGATYSGTFTTRGYPVQLTVKQNNLLLPGASVKIDGRSFVANKNSIITTELGDGDYTASITPPDSTTPQNATFTVAKKTIPSTGSPELQSFVLNITTVGGSSDASSAFLVPIIGGVVGFIATIGGVVGFIMYRRRQQLASAAGTVDSDLLTSSYGADVIDNRANTPQPNLETIGMAAGPMAIQEVMSDNGADALAVQQPYNDPAALPTAAPLDQTPPAVDGTQFDASGLPLPPAGTTFADQGAADMQASNAEYSEDEQLSPEVAQVEAAGEIGDDEPSAVYDASTGELDIIHHHAEPPTTAPLEQTEPEPYTVAGAELPPLAATEQATPTDTYTEETPATNSSQPPLTVPQ